MWCPVKDADKRAGDLPAFYLPFQGVAAFCCQMGRWGDGGIGGLGDWGIGRLGDWEMAKATNLGIKIFNH